MKQVILAEKPSQAKAYADSFSNQKRNNGFYQVSGKGFNNAIITYGFGHLVELYDPKEYNEEWKKWQLNTLPIFPKQYCFKVSKDKNKQYRIVKKHLDEADEIIIATDSDREGEAIARLIIRLSGNDHKTIKRLWINSLEKSEIQKGFQNLKAGQYYYSAFKEAETRQIADWLVGINLTRLYTLYMQKNNIHDVFSIGRVQTPTLYLIYQRNKAIADFVSEPFFELYASFSNEKGTYTGKYKKRFDSKEVIDKLKQNHQLTDNTVGTVEHVSKEKKKKFAPKLFSLSDLQSLANKTYNLSANQTLKIVQSLYEKKYVSYPRTDTTYIGKPEFNYLKQNLNKYLDFAEMSIDRPILEENKRYVNNAKVQEHYAIIPTRTIPESKTVLKDNEQKIYQMILKRTLSIFELPYQYEETIIKTNVNDIIFETKGTVEIDKGWKRIIKPQKEEQDEVLPNIKEQETISSQFETKEGKTEPPKFYTEGTLLSAMKNVGKEFDNETKEILKETEGIGTEATRANIIENLKQKKYIETKKKQLHVTEKGITLCEIIANDEIANAEMTAQWETYLKKIRNHKGTQEAFLQSIQRFITHLIDKAPAVFEQSNVQTHAQKIAEQSIIGTCPKCHNNIIEHDKFYGCAGYKDGCTFTLPKKWGKKKLSKKAIKDLLSKQKTSKLQGFKSKKGNKFSAVLKLDLESGKISFDFNN